MKAKRSDEVLETKRIELRINWDRHAKLNIVRADRTLSDLAGHCLVKQDFVRVAVSGKSVKNELPWIQFKLCTYVLDHERNSIVKYEP
jgi:hypothetical protein